jgi:hypothetical protein
VILSERTSIQGTIGSIQRPPPEQTGTLVSHLLPLSIETPQLYFDFYLHNSRSTFTLTSPLPPGILPTAVLLPRTGVYWGSCHKRRRIFSLPFRSPKIPTMNAATASSPAAHGKSEEEQKAITPQIREDVIGSSLTDGQGLAASPNIGAKGQVKSFQFWAVIAALSLTGLLAALESTVITSALPTIINTLGGGKNYVWIPNSYLLASIAILPFVAQVSDIFGRRWPMLGAVALFIFGSGLSGGASSVGMLIAGRTVYVLCYFPS